MAKSTNKTTATSSSVTAFIDAVPDETRRDDARQLVKLMKDVTGFEPIMWGPSIIGFGSYHYKYDSGHEGDAPLVGFSPRKAEISLYLATEFADKEKFLKQFGKHRAGKGCIYIKKLQDIDIDVLQKMIKSSVSFIQKKYPASEIRNEK